jgi:hypothetical protein
MRVARFQALTPWSMWRVTPMGTREDFGEDPYMVAACRCESFQMPFKGNHSSRRSNTLPHTASPNRMVAPRQYLRTCWAFSSFREVITKATRWCHASEIDDPFPCNTWLLRDVPQRMGIPGPRYPTANDH